MSVSSNDFLSFANNCLSCDSEINYRNFISRGYYGMYHKISSKLTSKPDFAVSHHSALIEYMKTPSQHKSEPFDSLKLKQLSYILSQERLTRNIADYNLDKDIDIKYVELSRKTQERFIEIVNNL